MINSILFSLFLIGSLSGSQQMLVRVYTGQYEDLNRIELKTLDIAGRSYEEYYDLVIAPQDYGAVVASGLSNEVISNDIDALKEQYRGSYHSYSEVVQILRNFVSNYPSICMLDSIGESYEGYWIYALKISDNPQIEEDAEPAMLFDGLHHSREWATIETVLFFGDTLTSGYGSDPQITALVDNNEIWLIPMVNVDGYRYDYPGQHMWRKCRKPFHGIIGTDPNRNYNGALNGDPKGDWGAIPYYGQVTHYPNSSTFCGALSGWCVCVDHMMNFHRVHDINSNISYHSYAEEVIWPWAYTSSKQTPDSILYTQTAQAIASRIHRVGSGYYQATGSLYPNTGTTRTWVYGIHHYIWGTSSLGFTIEIGTAFYEPTGNLDYIARENWKGALFLAELTDSIRDFVPAEVPAPDLVVPDTATQDSFTIYWSSKNEQYNSPDRWQLDHLEGYSYALDDLEAGSASWNLTGFSRSSSRSHSGNYSLFSGSSNNISNVAVTKHPYLVSPGDYLNFWCWYALETEYDVAVAEVSRDLNEWFQLDQRYNASSGGWQEKNYSLDAWAGEAVYFRFRCMTDDNTLNEGFYVDDIDPVPVFSSVSTVSSTITDTFYTVSGVPEGTHYYRVMGHNSRGWGNYSNIEKVIVNYVAVDEDENQPNKTACSIYSNISAIRISYVLPRAQSVKVSVYDATGRLIKAQEKRYAAGSHTERIGMEHSGVYFVRVQASGDVLYTDKVVILR
jgi:carboxypeptidase T